MQDKFINNIEVVVTGEISDEQLSTCLTKLQTKQKHQIIKATVTVGGKYIGVKYGFKEVNVSAYAVLQTI